MFRYIKILEVFQLLIDLVLLNVSINLYLLFNQYYHTGVLVKPSKIEYCLFNLLWLIFVARENLYRYLNVGQVYYKLVKIFLYYSVSIFIVELFFAQRQYIPKFLVWHLCLFFLLVLASITPVVFIVKTILTHGINNRKKVAIIGIDALSYKVANFFQKEYSGFEFLGFFDDKRARQNGYPLLGNIADSLAYIQSNELNEIYSTVLPSQNNIIKDLSLQAEKRSVRLRYILDNNVTFNGKLDFEMLDNIPILSLRREPLEDIVNRALKRTFDIVVAILAIALVLSWLYPLIAVLIKLTSKGPVLFIQERSGINGETFRCLKFRTMAVNDRADNIHASKHDSRITVIGKILRKTSLDELPQFINVLKNEMSIIGPRPHMIKHTEVFSEAINAYMVRHYIKPGITGWAQVNGYRGNATVETMTKRIEYDIDYIENWSVFFDIEILLRTLLLVLGGDKNAY